MMKNAMFPFVTMAWLLLNTLVCHTASTENDNSALESVTKLADHVSKLSDQFTRMSDQQAKQTDQLSKISDRLNAVEKKMRDEDAKQFIAGQVTDPEGKISASSAGPTFIRWGKRSCNGTSSEMIYFGVTAGTGDTFQGGGANLLCLPRNPTFGNYDGTNHPGVEVTVAEYQLDLATNFPFEHDDPLLLDHDVPCALCEVNNGSSVMMIPARVDCYSGWTTEYRGYLMATQFNIYRGEFICVDANPEPDYSGAGPANAKHGLYPVSAHTDPVALPSPPYYNNWELACVVCSK